MRLRRPWILTAGLVVSALLSGCGGGSTPAAATEASSAPAKANPNDLRGQLASKAAAAKDRRYVAGYTMSRPKQPVRSVLVTIATDDTWRVDIQGGALGGTADVSIAGRPEGQYQCALGTAPNCVRLAAAGKKLPAENDPRIQYPFTGWLDVFIDRRVALSVVAAKPLEGQKGTCYAVDPAVTALQPPVDAGVYCFADDGTPTGVQVPWATLTMAADPQPAPPTVALPGPVTNGQPLATSPPPPPSPSAKPPSPVPSASPHV
jgi:hypothetical protein